MKVMCSNHYCGRPLGDEFRAVSNRYCWCSTRCADMLGMPMDVIRWLEAHYAAKAAPVASPVAKPSTKADVAATAKKTVTQKRP